MSTETLRPNGAGNETNLGYSGASTNWECVDEVTSDKESSYPNDGNFELTVLEAF